MESTSIRSFSLYELVSSVRRCLEASFDGKYWVRAETSDVRRTGSSGHCYLELLEKGKDGGVRAKVRASIWGATYQSIDHSFRQAGLQSLTSGMSILALVQITYHEQYGLSLNIVDIDPSYSLGDIARLRMETIARLKRENIFTDNKSLPLPRLLLRLAIISSPTAAGLGDFLDQLNSNRYGLRFYTSLIGAQMQGDGTGQSIIRALYRIINNSEHFDAVIIIRGGGAVSDLRAFDSYDLCSACAQFPLPILCGIGHERDESVLDLVAHTSLKTPTAVAEYLIHRHYSELNLTNELAQRLTQATARLSIERARVLDAMTSRLPNITGRVLQSEHRRLSATQYQLSSIARRQVVERKQLLTSQHTMLSYISRKNLIREQERIAHTSERIRMPLRMQLERMAQRIEQYDQAIRLAHPDNILRRGFALVSHKGAIVTQADSLRPSDEIMIRLGESSVTAVIQ